MNGSDRPEVVARATIRANGKPRPEPPRADRWQRELAEVLWLKYRVQLPARVSAPRSVVPGERVLRAKVRRCRCGSQRAHATKDGGFSCGHCGAPWPGEWVVEPRTPGRRGGTALDGGLAYFIDFGRLFRGLSACEELVLDLYAVERLGPGRRVRLVAAEAKRRRPRQHWSEARAQEVLDRAVLTIVGAAQRAGLA